MEASLYVHAERTKTRDLVSEGKPFMIAAHALCKGRGAIWSQFLGHARIYPTPSEFIKLLYSNVVGVL